MKIFDQVTIILGAELRYFSGVTSASFATFETAAEANRRARALVRRSAQNGNNGNSQPSTVQSGRRPRTFNLQTVKFHFLGDYPWTIRRYGTTNSYNTQIVGQTAHTS